MLIISFVFEILHFYRARTRELMPYEIYIFLPSVTIFEFLRYVLPGDLGTNLSFFVDLSVLGYLLILSVVTVIYLIVISLNNYRTYEKSISYLNERIRDEEKLYRWFVVLLVSLIEARDPYTRSHSERVARYSYNLAKFVYKNTYMPNFIELSAFLHDIGKLGVRDEVLFYPGKLSGEYYEEMKKHPTIGKELLDSVSLFKDLSSIAYMHHERIDGLGYPRGLRGKEIPLYARIASIADSFDAMNSSRVYRNRLDVSEIFRELRDGANRQFDGNLVRIFIKNINRIA
jgi:HD-GYP domain-containing protein (c-di-GMP phosphodiesterase class II)